MLLSRHGATVTLTDMRETPVGGAERERLEKAGVTLQFGFSPERPDCDWLVVSPGVPVNASAVVRARSAELPVFGELEVASWFCRAPIAAITGSNGKTTTTALLAAMVQNSGRPCVLAGNIGEPFAGVVEQTVPEGVAVLEVSSFQLETVVRFRPSVSVLLNLTPDHLDRHGSMEIYSEMKARIFQQQRDEDVLVYNRDDRLVVERARNAACRTLAFSASDRQADAFLKDDSLWITLDTGPELLVTGADMQLRGEHNRLNGLAASLAAHSLGIPLPVISRTLRTFTSLPHRLEPVRTVDGVRYINDSKATNVDAVWYALGGFSDPVILIAGGRDKDSDFTFLKERVSERVKAMVLIGEAAGKIEKALTGAAPVIHAGSLKEAVDAARNAARPGDIVLLSPACASFDMFSNFEDRGDTFKTLVMEL